MLSSTAAASIAYITRQHGWSDINLDVVQQTHAAEARRHEYDGRRVQRRQRRQAVLRHYLRTEAPVNKRARQLKRAAPRAST